MKQERFGIWDFLIYLLLGTFCLTIVVAFLHLLNLSFSPSYIATKGGLLLWPRDVTMDNYSKVITNKYIWQGYKGEQIRKINKANVEYVGGWKKTKTYKATYKFVSKNATDTLDSKIVKLYREEYEAGTPDLKDKTEFTPKAITQTFSDTATGGTWKFKGWNPPKATVNGKDLEFTGTWELTK